MTEEAVEVLSPGDPLVEQLQLAGTFLLDSKLQTAARFDDIEIPAIMRRPASNTIGAYVRCSFWLAVALRVTLHQQKESGRWLLRPSSRAYKLAAASALFLTQGTLQAGFSATKYAGVGWIAQFISGRSGAVPRSSERRDIRRVYDQAIRHAAEAGARKVQRELQALAQAKPVKDEAGIIPDVLTNDDGDLAWWVPVAVGSTVLVIGAALLSPYILAAAPAVGGLIAATRR